MYTYICYTYMRSCRYCHLLSFAREFGACGIMVVRAECGPTRCQGSRLSCDHRSRAECRPSREGCPMTRDGSALPRAPQSRRAGLESRTTEACALLAQAAVMVHSKRNALNPLTLQQVMGRGEISQGLSAPLRDSPSHGV